MKPKKIAIVAEWLTSRAGAEVVVYELAKMFPQADIFTTVFDPSNHPKLKKRRVKTSFLQKIPVLNKIHQLALFLLPMAISSLNLEGYDLIISSSSAFGKGIKKPSGSRHICYCHTPMRYVWEPDLDNRLAKLPLGNLIIKWLKKWDLKSNKSVDQFIANSQNSALRIKKYYGCESKVVYPPIATDLFKNVKTSSRRDYYFTISRLIAYKKIDLAIKACKNIGRKLIIAGSGPELKKLKRIAGNEITFTGQIGEREKVHLYCQARATIFCADEDFGIVPVESLAAGTPVIGYKKGGILEIIEDKKTGVLFDNQTAKSLRAAIAKFEKLSFDRNKLIKSSMKFDSKHFKDKMLSIIKSL
ncbi:glycosyltransferase family 4 protein [Candidatus Berkelbacteria bacterium CG10_big_fil_rev_8_21_14_0_10_41_12]|uniref:Glycosyltransferase family 4 protein n=1 Tax=Candidatus Berkelbacteria bacterium CG10_big_fil_rev_8_21_14_0_10_41_12 TaxID=1974513 RepID=A0A2M6WY01_9BACT|nr:MAG: glycosyltransferase family 4 protein [Candidatus Berkelbacteria bacterium CG10_big_fil_rev_8_21_14_0_10_41_12]